MTIHRRTPRPVSGLLALLLVGTVTACGAGGGDDVDPDADAALEKQRRDVRALAGELRDGAAEALSAEAVGHTAAYEGCESAFNDVYRSYQYLARVRMTAPPASGGLLGPLFDVVERAGLTRSESDDPSKLRAHGDELTVSFWALPEETDQGDLLLSVHGPCVEVPEDEREKWLHHQEPEPEIE